MLNQDLARLLTIYISRATAKSQNQPNEASQHKINKCKDFMLHFAKETTTPLQWLEHCINLDKEAQESQKNKSAKRTSSIPGITTLLNNRFTNAFLGSPYSEFSWFLHGCRSLIIHHIVADQESPAYKAYQDFVVPRWEAYKKIDAKIIAGTTTRAKAKKEIENLLTPLAALGFSKAINELDKMDYFIEIGYEYPPAPSGLQWSMTTLYPNPNRPFGFQTKAFNDVIEKFASYEQAITVQDSKEHAEEKQADTKKTVDTDAIEIELATDDVKTFLTQYSVRRETAGKLDSKAKEKIAKCKAMIERISDTKLLSEWIKICVDLNNEANASQKGKSFINFNNEKSDYMMYLHAARNVLLQLLTQSNTNADLQTYIELRWKEYEKLDNDIANGHVTREHANKEVETCLSELAALGDLRAICELGKIKRLQYWNYAGFEFPTRKNRETYTNQNVPLVYHANWSKEDIVNQHLVKLDTPTSSPSGPKGSSGLTTPTTSPNGLKGITTLGTSEIPVLHLSNDKNDKSDESDGSLDITGIDLNAFDLSTTPLTNSSNNSEGSTNTNPDTSPSPKSKPLGSSGGSSSVVLTNLPPTGDDEKKVEENKQAVDTNAANGKLQSTTTLTTFKPAPSTHSNEQGQGNGSVHEEENDNGEGQDDGVVIELPTQNKVNKANRGGGKSNRGKGKRR